VESRPLIRTIIKVVAREIGDKIYDGAVGSAGFLCEAFDYLKNNKKLTTSDTTNLQRGNRFTVSGKYLKRNKSTG